MAGADGDANIALLFWRGDGASIADAIRDAMNGRQWHLASLTGLTDDERDRLRDALYDAARSVGLDMAGPVRIVVEQARDDPRVFHVIDAEFA